MSAKLGQIPVMEKDDFKTFLVTCHKEKVAAELGTDESQLIIEEFKSEVRKHILECRGEEYCQVYEPNSIQVNIILIYLRYNKASVGVRYKYDQCIITIDTKNLDE